MDTWDGRRWPQMGTLVYPNTGGLWCLIGLRVRVCVCVCHTYQIEPIKCRQSALLQCLSCSQWLTVTRPCACTIAQERKAVQSKKKTREHITWPREYLHTSTIVHTLQLSPNLHATPRKQSLGRKPSALIKQGDVNRLQMQQKAIVLPGSLQPRPLYQGSVSIVCFGQGLVKLL